MSDVNINPNSANAVTIQNIDNNITITDSSKSTKVNVTQETTKVVNVASQGPQGPIGPQGIPGAGFDTPFTGSVLVSGSIKLNGNLTASNITSTSGSFSYLEGNSPLTIDTNNDALTIIASNFKLSPTGEISSGIGRSDGVLTTSITASNISSSAKIIAQSITGSLSGSALESISSSFALTASYINSLHQDVIITGSLTGNSSSTSSFGHYIGDGSGLTNVFEGTFASQSISTRITTNESAISTLNSSGLLSSSAQIASDISGAFNAPSSSFSTRVSTNESNITAITSSLTANRVVFTTTGGQLSTDAGMTYDSTNDKLTVQSLNVVHLTSSFITASTIQTSGSNIFGDDTTDTQTLIGTTILTGSAKITGSLNVSNTISGSNLSGTNTGDQDLSPYALKTSITGAFSESSASFSTRITTNKTDISNLTSKTGSYATTGSNSFNGNQQITGSLNISGSLNVNGSSRTLFTTSSLVYSGSNVTQVTQSYEAGTQQITNILYSGSFADGNPLSISVTGSDGVSKLYTMEYSASLITQILVS